MPTATNDGSFYKRKKESTTLTMDPISQWVVCIMSFMNDAMYITVLL